METNKTSIEDLKKQALEHYEEISLKACHYNSFVVKCIKEYNPERTAKEFERGRKKGFKEGYKAGLRVDKTDL
jgi:hypothetical protein